MFVWMSVSLRFHKIRTLEFDEPISFPPLQPQPQAPAGDVKPRPRWMEQIISNFRATNPTTLVRFRRGRATPLRPAFQAMAQHAKDKELFYDSQRKRIEKLMEDPDRLLDMPDTSMSLTKGYQPPDFVRNVMGSSAGAGSGEFHVYRHLRRKEIARLKSLGESAVADELDNEFKAKLDETKRKAEERTMKRRSKRERKKQNKLKKKQLKSVGESSKSAPVQESDDDDST